MFLDTAPLIYFLDADPRYAVEVRGIIYAAKPAPHAGLDVRRAHGLKLLRNEGRGVLCVERQFGMPVQMPPPLYKLGVQRPRLVPDDCPA